MAKDEFLNSLFDAHTADLNDVYPGQGDIVVCPICLEKFPRKAIAEDYLTDGHVWSQYFRKNSEKAKHMRVLICRTCNHTAGTRLDKQMQLQEQIIDGENRGEWFGNRRVQLIKPNENPINLNVKITGNLSNFRISGRANKDKKWLDSSPEDQARFHSLVEKGEKISIIIDSPNGFEPEKVPVGWIMSSYLMAFYTLGYRYIFDSSLDPVREYIVSSMMSDNSQQSLPKAENFTIRQYKDNVYPEPEIVFVYPLNKSKFVYLQINYVRYEIRLPFRYAKPILDELFLMNRNRINELTAQSSDDLAAFTMPISCTKLEIHDCIYDYLLGKPLPFK